MIFKVMVLALALVAAFYMLAPMARSAGQWVAARNQQTGIVLSSTAPETERLAGSLTLHL